MPDAAARNASRHPAVLSLHWLLDGTAEFTTGAGMVTLALIKGVAARPPPPPSPPLKHIVGDGPRVIGAATAVVTVVGGKVWADRPAMGKLAEKPGVVLAAGTNAGTWCTGMVVDEAQQDCGTCCGICRQTGAPRGVAGLAVNCSMVGVTARAAAATGVGVVSRVVAAAGRAPGRGDPV